MEELRQKLESRILLRPQVLVMAISGPWASEWTDVEEQRMKSRNHRLGRWLSQHIYHLIQDDVKALTKEKKCIYTYNMGNLAFEKLLPHLTFWESIAKLSVDHTFKRILGVTKSKWRKPIMLTLNRACSGGI